MIPYGKQNISEEDIKAVVTVLRSDFITQGPTLPRFEKAISDHVGAAHCIAVNSATSALHIAMLSLDVGPGDTVWTTPITFVATANAALYCGADVDFVDICSSTFNMDMAALEAKLKTAEAEGRLPKVVAPVHLTGRSCDMKALDILRKKYGFRVVEDASHAIGAQYGGQFVGSCPYSDLCVFSFHPVKIITTGEGGAITTNDPALARKLASFRSHGITRDPVEMESNDGPWYYEQQELGFNYRMTELQAALGLSQMSRLDAFVARRRKLAERYDRLLSGSDILRPVLDSDENQSSWHLYVMRLAEGSTPLARRHLFEKLRSHGIGVNVHYIPVTRQPYYRALGFDPLQFPVAEAYYDRSISLPLYFDMTEREQDTVVKCLLEPAGYQTIF
ncbi:UDP-4-amino-4,6-dideoxy-N-acetyl-beta-L-altrosamine transaminase [Rhodobacteraceae bacterium M385]|nr:UDP-4-amino-4,6-dideoxy-N-acetyl-beta-L-altrosamine transaminase [Rhodobacteraceae bacterium M385]